ncbi:MAG: choice-of-anchor D domain-containing protein [Myxococcota bacterium]
MCACGEENLQEAQARISVCASPEAPEEECNRPLDFGEQPLTLTRDVVLHVVNRGESTLTLESVTSSDGALTVVDYPPGVEVSASEPLRLALTPAALGDTSAQLEIKSNDRERGTLILPLAWHGTPKPVPRFELCVDDIPPTCGTDITLDFGAVRRSQRESRTLQVRNAGTATLQILEVEQQGQSTSPDEIIIGTSTRPGHLPPETSAPVVVLYEPADGTADEVKLVFTSDDPEHPVATLTVRGTSADNLPPTADARHVGTGLTLADVAVGDVVTLDGTFSSDPEGDPLTYLWTLYSPATSSSSLDDPSASRVTLTPDTSGTYRVELLVTDSLGQVSSPSGLVLLRARPRQALKVTLDWEDGGDVDLHLVAPGGTLFGPLDCSFENPNPELGDTASDEDDPLLQVDSQGAPGHEEITLVTPVAGTYGIYAHYFEDVGVGPATVTARVVFNDSGIFALQETLSLPAACSLWHIGDVTFPANTASPSAAPLAQQCR